MKRTAQNLNEPRKLQNRGSGGDTQKNQQQECKKDKSKRFIYAHLAVINGSLRNILLLLLVGLAVPGRCAALGKTSAVCTPLEESYVLDLTNIGVNLRPRLPEDPGKGRALGADLGPSSTQGGCSSGLLLCLSACSISTASTWIYICLG